MAEADKWSRWLAETRFGGDQKAAEAQMRMLMEVRDLLLKKGGLGEGKVVLDVGAGEGMMGFGALEKVGATGRVIFSDISQALVEFMRQAAEQMGVQDRCSFIKAGAEDLSAIESDSVDLVTTRSVLIYVDDKPRAFREFHRVLKPGGRTALFEPIDDRRMTEFSWLKKMWAESDSPETAPIKHLLERWRGYWKNNNINEAMTNFNERDLVQMSVDAGFAAVRTEVFLHAWPTPPMKWDTWMNMSGNPLIPTSGEVMRQIFNADEQALFEKHLRPSLERGGRLWPSQSSFTWALKAPLPEKPFAGE